MQGIREQCPLVVAQEIVKGIHARIWLAGRFRLGWVAWEGGKLVAVKEGKPPRGAGGIVDLGDARVVPGFVDTLLHGFGGHDVGEASAHELHSMTQALASAGVTTALAGFYPLEMSGLRRAARRWDAWKSRTGSPRARIPGWHVEGPFIAPGMRGALPRTGILQPTSQNVARLLKACGGWLKMATLAPERRGVLKVAQALRSGGVLPSVGHTAAGIEDCRRLAETGPLAITHLGNRMPPVSPREPGPMGFALLGEASWVGLIPDATHVSNDFLALCTKTPTLTSSLMVVSDNLSHAGLSGADFHAGGKRLHRDGAVARDARGGLAGTLDSLPELLAARVAEGALTWAQAIRMGAEVPGRLFGDCGRFEPGLRADLVTLNSEGGVDQVWVGGRRAAN